MTFLKRTVFAFAGLLAIASAHAASGNIDGFSSNTTKVQVGGTVDFSASFSFGTTSWSGGGSNPIEPEPVEGYQEWYVNWYSWEAETLTNVSLQAGGQSFNDFPSVGPGDSYANSWSFSLTFDQPGTFDIGVSGSWESTVSYGYSNESAWRNCYADEYGSLSCDGWTWQYSDGSDWYTASGGLSGPSISIEVVAVPEPQTALLMLAGAALLALRVRRRR